MTRDQVQAVVAELHRMAAVPARDRDDEAIFGLEVKLWRDVLETIATGIHNSQVAKELAEEALKTQFIEINRWGA